MSKDTKSLIRIQQVEAKTGYSRPTIYKKMKAGEFPKQIPLGERAVAWLESEVDDWVDSRIAQRDKG